MIKVRIEQMPHGIGLDLPKYATADSAGVDLMAAIEEDIILKPGARCLVPSGFIIALPRGFEGQIRPRSGLALKNGLTVLNAPGTVDADYRGEVKVILINLGHEDFTITRGMRIAQLVIAPFVQVSFEEGENLEQEKTGRSSEGFGSTGLA
jgi:dUTP pyrophosphatase